MKNTLTPPSSTTPVKQDPFKRLSLAVKKLDQLISRTHQLGTCTNEFLRDEATGTNAPSPEANLTQSAPTRSSTMAHTSEKLLEK